MTTTESPAQKKRVPMRPLISCATCYGKRRPVIIYFFLCVCPNPITVPNHVMHRVAREPCVHYPRWDAIIVELHQSRTYRWNTFQRHFPHCHQLISIDRFPRDLRSCKVMCNRKNLGQTMQSIIPTVCPDIYILGFSNQTTQFYDINLMCNVVLTIKISYR